MTPQVVISDLISHLLNEIDRDPSVAPRFERCSSVRDVWGSLLFCILSSQVRAATATSAVQVILAEVPFFEENLSSVDVYNKLGLILRRSDVRHRFPETRSKQIASSWFAFAQIKDEFYGYLDSFSAEKDARVAVADRFSGLGFKQASMFLRDIGYSARLCVIDTHILWYCERMSSPLRGALTTRRYLEIEEYLLETADTFRIAPNIFDSAVWAAVKTFKGRQCMMQFA
jgi:N-glycosylase/DNA lyase